MGLYLKAKDFLVNVREKSLESNNLQRFLKGKSLLKKLTSEEESSNDSIIVQEDDSNKESLENLNLNDNFASGNDEISSEKQPEKLELPDDLGADSIIINEEEEIETDICNGNFDYYEIPIFIKKEKEIPKIDQNIDPIDEDKSEESIHPDQYLEDNEIAPSETIEIGSDSNKEDQELKDWEEDISKEDIPNKDDNKKADELLESYTLIKEIVMELLQSSNLNEFYDNLLYSIEGQLGSGYLIFFSSIDEKLEQFEIISYDGLELTENIYLTSEAFLIQSLIEKKGILETSSINLDQLTQEELSVVSKSKNEIIVPIYNNESLLGFFILGENISGSEYSSSDLDFLNQLVEWSKNILIKLYNDEKINKEYKKIERIKYATEDINQFFLNISKLDSLQTVFNHLTDLLKKLDIFSHFSIYELNNKFNYDLKYSSHLNSNTNIISQDELIIKELQTKKDLILLNDKNELNRLGLGVNDSYLVPLIYDNSIISIFIIEKSDTFDLRKNIFFNQILQYITVQIYRMRKEYNLTQFNVNPLYKIEELIKDELIQAQNYSKNFMLYVIKIQNVTRIINILGNEYFETYDSYLQAKIKEVISDKDLYFKIGQSKLCIFIRERTKDQNMEVKNLLKSKINEFENPPKDFKIALNIYSLEYPEQSLDLRKYIDLIEET